MQGEKQSSGDAAVAAPPLRAPPVRVARVNVNQISCQTSSWSTGLQAVGSQTVPSPLVRATSHCNCRGNDLETRSESVFTIPASEENILSLLLFVSHTPSSNRDDCEGLSFLSLVLLPLSAFIATPTLPPTGSR